MYAFSKSLAVISFGAALLFGGLFGFGVSGPWPWAAAAAALLCAVTTSFVAYTQNRHEAPNALRAHFGANVICETDGVQLVGVSPPEVPPGAQFVARVFVQNGWDAPRSVSFHLTNDDAAWSRLERKLSGAPAQPFGLPPAITVTLDAAAVGCLELPLAVHPSLSGTHRARLHVRVSGTGGARVLHWRAPYSVHPVPEAVTTVLMLFGIGFANGGAAIEVRAKPGAPIDARATDLTGPVWHPRAELDSAAAPVPAGAAFETGF